jgi:hypothetical protein
VRVAIATLTIVTLLAAGCGSPPRKPAAADGQPSTVPAGDPAPIGSTDPSTAPPGTAPSGPATAGPAGVPKPGSCAIFPADNVWHADVSKLPVHPRSVAYLTSIGPTRPVHPDWGTGFGIPITTIGAGQAKVPVTFDESGESDRGPYPIPPNALVEGGPNSGGDRHVIVHDTASCHVYELFDAHRSGGGWHAYSGAVFDLRSNRMRPMGWTSADAAGLSIMAGLVRYDEVATGHVDHAIRMTVPVSQRAWVWPGSHRASSRTDANLPPMGLRLRLKAGVDTSRLPPQARTVAEALKRYGAIVADNGSPFFFTGTQDSRWSNSQLDALKRLHGSDFEVVDESSLMMSPTSYAVRR